jgi:hypothetical protein
MLCISVTLVCSHALVAEWNRKRSVTDDELEEQHKLTFGMLFSLNVRSIAAAAANCQSCRVRAEILPVDLASGGLPRHQFLPHEELQASERLSCWGARLQPRSSPITIVAIRPRPALRSIWLLSFGRAALGPYLETATCLKLVLTTDPNVGDLKEQVRVPACLSAFLPA